MSVIYIQQMQTDAYFILFISERPHLTLCDHKLYNIQSNGSNVVPSAVNS